MTGSSVGEASTSGELVTALDLLLVGAFARSSEGSYLIGAPGDSTFLAWASTDVRRPEDRGDSAGPLLLLEGGATNKCLQSETLGTTWTTLNSPTLSADVQAAPDGVTDADRIAYAAGGGAGQVRQTFTAAAITSSVPACVSVFLRKGNGSDQLLLFFRNKSAVDTSVAQTPGSAWARHAITISNTGSGATSPILALIESTDGVDFDAWGVQLEEGRRAPSSYIRTTTAAVTRAADSLELASSALPSSFWSKRYRFAQYSPREAHTDLVSGDVRWLWTQDSSSDGLRLRHNGTDVRIEAVAGGTVKASSGALTFARHALLGEIDWDPVAAVVRVGGVAGSAGTPWSWSVGTTVRIGGIAGSSGSELDGRLGNLVEV